MTPDTFLKEFGNLADAPSGVEKVRRMILMLAVRGDLIETKPTDGTVEQLLRDVKAEKTRLVKEGLSKKSSPLPEIGDDEKPFDTPDHWRWVRLDTVCSYIQRGKGPKYTDRSNVPIVSQKCIQWTGFSLEKARFLDPNALAKYRKERFLRSGDLLWNSTGTGTIGRVNVFPGNIMHYENLVADSHVTVVRPAIVDPKYLWTWIAGPVVQDEIEEMASGTTNQIELNTSTVKEHLVPVPPLAEQKRIVEKVDELMALCDELEARQTKRNEARVRLNNASLDALINAQDPDELAHHWSRLRNNFDVIYDAPSTLLRLGQSIAQVAVRGRLTASIHEEKWPARLSSLVAQLDHDDANGSAKRSKRAKILPSESSELDFALPRFWCCERLGKLADIIGGVTKGRKIKEPITISCPYLRVANVQRGFLSLDVLKQIDVTSEEIKKYELMQNDLLVTEGGDWDKVGRTAIWRDEISGCIHQNHIFRVRLVVDQILPEWIQLFLNSSDGRRYFERSSKQTTNLASINMTQLRNTLIPLPPLLTQEAIVAKIDELVALCHALESKLTAAQTTSQRLLDASINSLVHP